MGENSKIEWTDHTFNPWWGCTKVSEGCQHCYADTLAHRYKFKVWGPTSERRKMSDAHWLEPLKWDRLAATAGVRKRVFCASMADVFEGLETCQDPDAFAMIERERIRLFSVIYKTPNLDWLLLTKRPQNVMAMVPDSFHLSGWPANIRIGTSVENQKAADIRIPELIKIPAPNFVSCEPLLDKVDLSPWLIYPPLAGMPKNVGISSPAARDWRPLLHWVIVGGESGPNARPMHPDWARGLRDQCSALGVPFFFKQWGAWVPAPWKPVRLPSMSNEEYKVDAETIGATHALMPGGHLYEPSHKPWSGERTRLVPPATGFRRVGKHAAGRLLEGREWNEMPAVAESRQ